LCVACGMIPIFNPRLNLAICSMCDGPVKYTGNTINNLEILPPIGRPKSRIVQVEIPYSTKLLTQEQETYLNMAMRYMTTSGFQRLTPFEFSGTSSEMVKELTEMIYPETNVPEYMDAKPIMSLTAEQLASMSAQANHVTMEEKKRLDVIQEEKPLDENGEEIIPLDGMGQNMGYMAQNMGQNMGQNIAQNMGQNMGFQQQQPQPQQQPQNEIIMPQMMGGMPAPDFGMPVTRNSQEDGVIQGGRIPGMGPMIAVRTDVEAFERDGISIGGPMGGRPIRRNMYRGEMNASPMGPMVQQYTPASGGYLSAVGGQSGGMQSITITKLE
jgi:hypothetical protein